MITDVLEWLGSKYGDQDEYLVCESCDRRFEWTDSAPRSCPACDVELHVHVPNSKALGIRWTCWKTDQTWLPQRFYALPSDDEPPYRYWAWLGREWRVRSWEGLTEWRS